MKIAHLFEGRILTISNLLSVLRVFLVPPMGYCFYLFKQTGDPRYNYLALGVGIVIMLTDYFDGYLARLLKQETMLGRFLDPLADKFTFYITGTLLYWYYGYPLWVILAVLARDIFAIAGGYLIFAKKNIQGTPNRAGKWAVFFMGMSAVAYILAPTVNLYGITLQHASLALLVVCLVVSLVQYLVTYGALFSTGDR